MLEIHRRVHYSGRGPNLLLAGMRAARKLLFSVGILADCFLDSLLQLLNQNTQQRQVSMPIHHTRHYCHSRNLAHYPRMHLPSPSGYSAQMLVIAESSFQFITSQVIDKEATLVSALQLAAIRP